LLRPSVGAQAFRAIRGPGAPSSDAPLVADLLPLGHRLLPGFQLPGARGGVVVAESLTETALQHGIGPECEQRRIERRRKHCQVRPGVGISDHRFWRTGAATQAVRGRDSDRRQRQVWIGVRAGSPALETAELWPGGIYRAHRAGPILDAPADVG